MSSRPTKKKPRCRDCHFIKHEDVDEFTSVPCRYTPGGLADPDADRCPAFRWRGGAR